LLSVYICDYPEMNPFTPHDPAIIVFFFLFFSLFRESLLFQQPTDRRAFQPPVSSLFFFLSGQVFFFSIPPAVYRISYHLLWARPNALRLAPPVRRGQPLPGSGSWADHQNPTPPVMGRCLSDRLPFCASWYFFMPLPLPQSFSNPPGPKDFCFFFPLHVNQPQF